MVWSRLNCGQSVIFAVSFVCLASRHVALLGWSMGRPMVVKEMEFTSTQMGLMDTAYMLSYAFGNMLSGNLGDTYPLKLVVSLGLGLTSLVLVVVAGLGFYEVKVIGLFLCLWIANGLCQSVVRPCAVALMGNWFPRLSRGRIMGIWSSSTSVGDVIGAELGGLMLYLGYSWEAILLLCAVIVATVSIVFALVAEDKPPLDLLAADVCCDKEFFLVMKHRSGQAKHGINFFEAWKIPGVLSYSLAFACVKLLLYGMLFWLPFFLSHRVHLTGHVIGMITAMFAVGGILGSSVGGWLSDQMKGYRSFVLMPMVGITIPLLLLFEVGSHEETYWLFYIVIPIIGFMNAGASHLMCTAVAADLAEKCEAKRNDDAKATVTGIMNGVGSLGAAAGGILIGWLQTFSWDYVFFFLISVSTVATALLVVITLSEYRESKRLSKPSHLSIPDNSHYSP